MSLFPTPHTSPSIKRSEQDGTMDTVSSGTAGAPSSQDTTNNSVIRDSDHHTDDSYMIFWILLTLNNIVSFLNVEPKTTRPPKFDYRYSFHQQLN